MNLEDLPRYKREAVWHGRRLIEEMRPDPDGRWVKFRDVRKLLAESDDQAAPDDAGGEIAEI